MLSCMADSAMLRHMSEHHAMHGAFRWNDARTQCIFLPDSMMTPATRYMNHMGTGMMRMMEERMGGGAMEGHGSGTMAGHMMLHFTTMDTTGVHDGHH